MGRTRSSRRRGIGKGRAAQQKLRAMRRTQEYLSAYKAQMGCSKCGETFGPCLHLHHVDPGTKRSWKDTAGYAKTMAQARRIIKQCVVLCANCHAKLHHGFFDGELVPVKKSIDLDQLPMFPEANGHDTTA